MIYCENCVEILDYGTEDLNGGIRKMEECEHGSYFKFECSGVLLCQICYNKATAHNVSKVLEDGTREPVRRWL